MAARIQSRSLDYQRGVEHTRFLIHIFFSVNAQRMATMNKEENQAADMAMNMSFPKYQHIFFKHSPETFPLSTSASRPHSQRKDFLSKYFKVHKTDGYST